MNQCSLIHFKPDKEKIIKKFNYYLDQETTKGFCRKRSKKNSRKMKSKLSSAAKRIQQLIKSDKEQSDLISNNSSDNSIENFEESQEIEEESPSSSQAKMLKIPRASIDQKYNFDDPKSYNDQIVSSSDYFQTLSKKTTSKFIDYASNKNYYPPNFDMFEDTKSPKSKEEMKSSDNCAIKISENNMEHRMDPSFIKDIESKVMIGSENFQEPFKKRYENVIRKNFITLQSADYEGIDITKSKSTNLGQEEAVRRNIRNPTEFSEKRGKKNQIINSSKKIPSMVDQNPSSLIGKELPVTVSNENIMDYFEIVANFKNYFPENNIRYMLENANRRKYYRKHSKIKSERKKSIETRLSKYTFFPEEMKNRLPSEINRRVKIHSRKSKKSKIDTNSNYEMAMTERDEMIARNRRSTATGKHKRYFTSGIFDQKFSDVVKYVMSHPALKKKLKSKS